MADKPPKKSFSTLVLMSAGVAMTMRSEVSTLLTFANQRPRRNHFTSAEEAYRIFKSCKPFMSPVSRLCHISKCDIYKRWNVIELGMPSLQRQDSEV